MVFYYCRQVIRRSLAAYVNTQARKKAVGFAEGARFINGFSRIYGWGNIYIGADVKIMDGAFINAKHGQLIIGNNAILSRNCTIFTWSHEYEGERLPFDDGVRSRNVSIGKNVWVGMNVTILPGAQIGEGAIVGAGSVVAGVVDPLQIVGAAAASPIGKRNKEHYNKILRGR